MFNPDWINNQVRERSDRVAVKLREADGTYIDSVLIPTERYPLNSDKFEVFPKGNPEAATDERIIEAFNAVKYQMGCCYTNSKNLYEELTKRGVEAKTYVGWLFLSGEDYPTHHCWVVVGDTVLDLSDDFTVMMCGNVEVWKEVESKEDARKLMAQFAAEAKSVSNAQRCAPLGVPTVGFLYVGSECSPSEGRQIFNRLMAKYPDHECYKKTNEVGMTETQAYIARNSR